MYPRTGAWRRSCTLGQERGSEALMNVTSDIMHHKGFVLGRRPHLLGLRIMLGASQIT